MTTEMIPVAGPPPAAVSVADTSALIQANDRLQADLAQTRAELARNQAADVETRKSAAIAEALVGVPLVEGGLGHLTTILEKQISFQPDPATGKLMAVGPGLKPATDHIRGLLGSKEYSCFVRAQNPGGGTAGGTAQQSLHTPAANNPWNQPAAPKTIVEALVLDHQERKAAQGTLPPPAADMSQSMFRRGT